MKKNIMKKLILSLIAITFNSYSSDYNPSIDWKRTFQSIFDIQTLKFELQVLKKTCHRYQTDISAVADRLCLNCNGTGATSTCSLCNKKPCICHPVNSLAQKCRCRLYNDRITSKLLVQITYLEEKIKMLTDDDIQEANTSK